MSATGDSFAPSALALLDDSMRLVRRNPEGLAWYYIGTGPFVAGLFYYWYYITALVPDDGAILCGALVLTALFGWMKLAQHRFALLLVASWHGTPAARWPLRTWVREASLQFRLHSSRVALVPFTFILIVPFCWVNAYYNSAAVCSGGTAAERRRDAWNLMQLWPRQNVQAALVIAALSIMTALNIGVLCYFVPKFFSWWLGLPGLYAQGGWQVVNAGFCILVFAITFLLVNPLYKTFFILRVYHGRARSTGDDIRLLLRDHRASLLPRMGAVVLIFLGLVSTPSPSRAVSAEPVSRPSSVPATEMNAALDRILARPEYRWRLRSAPAESAPASHGFISRILAALGRLTSRLLNNFADLMGRVWRWLRSLAGMDKDSSPEGGRGAQPRFLSVMVYTAYILLLLAVGVFLFLAWRLWRQKTPPPPKIAGAAAPNLDLRDEAVEASRLPSEGWVQLAREQAAAGNGRLALRALFLATLARHAHAGLLAIAKYKTNLDYERELQRRAFDRTTVWQDFKVRRQSFEEVWYGERPARPDYIQDWLKVMETVP